MKMQVNQNSLSSASSPSELSSDDCSMKDNSSERISSDMTQNKNTGNFYYVWCSN